ncbi:MAG: DNA repair protein RadA [Lachnospiraceae bacterium]|nr:DNA repair protein RadA [Lachnospiraceae bacterium]
MAKSNIKSIFFCNECGYESSKWVGQCPACKAWNSMVEEKVDKKIAAKTGIGLGNCADDNKPVSIGDISLDEEDRITIGIGELDRVLGGGIVPGSLTLVGGDPGIGKSTLLLQVCRQLSDKGTDVLYISGEESLKQIKLRAVRIGPMNDRLMLLCETNLENICEQVKRSGAKVVVIDSIQTMYSDSLDAAAGSVSQVREATAMLMRMAKEKSVSVFIVGHVTKEGTVAGPRVLEHMVDTVLYFEGDRHASYRILRGVKNRFGSTNEIGVFEMKNEGLAEVPNPSEYMLSGRPVDASGAIVSCAIEGTRPILIELQALVTRTNFGFPRRQSTGSDTGRLNLLMAVLEKRLDMKIGDHDAYVNIAGGLKIQEPAIDLAIVLSVVSSFRNRALSDDLVVFGEVGLNGEVRAVSNASIRVSEAKKLGFKRVVLPVSNKDSVDVKGIELIYVSSIEEALDKVI